MMQPTIERFAESYRLKITRDADGESIIRGKYGHIYEHGDGSLGLIFLPESKPRLWNKVRRKLETASFAIWQDGDQEGSVLFDPTSQQQSSLAIKTVKCKLRRTASPLQSRSLAAARAALAKSRLSLSISSDSPNPVPGQSGRSTLAAFLVGLIVSVFLLILLTPLDLAEETPKTPKFKRGRTMLVYVGEDDHGRIVLDPYLAPQLSFKMEPTVPGTVITPLKRGQALTCDYFTVVRVVGTDDKRELVYSINLRCHGKFGPRYILDGIAFR